MFLVYMAVALFLSLRSLYRALPPASVSTSTAQRSRLVFYSFLIGSGASIDFLQSYGFSTYPSG